MLEVSPEVPQGLLGDDVRLRQVLVNLLSNAIKFTERGAVRLQLTVIQESQGDPMLQFRIQDTGIGMSPEVRARLFKPFEQGDGSITRRYGGTGLGIVASAWVVTALVSSPPENAMPTFSPLGRFFRIVLMGRPFGQFRWLIAPILRLMGIPVPSAFDDRGKC